MRMIGPCTNWYRWLRRNASKIAPYTHILPKYVRQKFLGHLFDQDKFRLPIPLPYEPGLYPNGVNLVGYFKAENGLAQGVKLYAKALAKSNIPHMLINANILHFLPQNDTAFDGKLRHKPNFAINVTHINPDQYQMVSELFSLSAFDKRYNIAVWLWELENIPKEWLWVFPYLNEIWTPSQFIRDAIRKVSPIPVTLIPYGIEAPVNVECDRTFFGLPKDAFIVLCMFDSNSYASRKNPLGALEAFAKAFGRKHPRAIMVLKINNPKEEDLQKIKADVGESENTIFFTKTLEKAQANALINCCDVFISLHRSEGFGLVMAEAMLLGRAVIATNWSANTEFMNEKVACMVDYQFVSTNGQYQYDNTDQRWADANIDQAAYYLRRLYEDPLYYEQISNAGKAYIKEHLSPKNSAMAMEKRIWEILRANCANMR